MPSETTTVIEDINSRVDEAGERMSKPKHSQFESTQVEEEKKN